MHEAGYVFSLSGAPSTTSHIEYYLLSIFGLLHLVHISLFGVELAWPSSSVMDCHVRARGWIPSGNGVFTDLHVLMSFPRDSKWGYRLEMTSLMMERKTQPTNQPLFGKSS